MESLVRHHATPFPLFQILTVQEIYMYLANSSNLT